MNETYTYCNMNIIKMAAIWCDNRTEQNKKKKERK